MKNSSTIYTDNLYLFMESLKIKRDEGFFKDVLDSITDRFYVVDNKYRIVYANKALGTSVEGKHCYEVTHGLKMPCWKSEKSEICPWREIIKTGNPASALHEHTYNGKKKFVAVFAYPIKSNNKKLIGFIEFTRKL